MLADAYEELRQAATGIPGTGRSLRGRVILIRQGMAAWIRALMEAVASEATTVSAPPTLDGVRVAAGMQREVVELLATMALTATSTEVRT
jgi:hypothetical protein